MAYIDDAQVLLEPISSLELEITTVDAGNAKSGNALFVNVVFTDGTRLYEPLNHHIQLPGFSPVLPPRGKSRRVSLPVTPNVERTLGEIAEVFLRKSGKNGWFVGQVLLRANDHELPLLGNRHANQFIDIDDDVLLLREWSTASFCVAPLTEVKHPLPRSGYRVLGPVLGQVSHDSAVVLYRVDREGTYRFRATDAANGDTVLDQDLEPTGRFELTELQPERRYDFDLSFVRAGVESPVPDAAGSLVTYPADGTPGKFSFAFGSCANPDKQDAQGAWTGIRSLAEAPPLDIEPVRLFVHLGDTFYFYDHMTKEEVANVESMHAAHVSQRRHLEFLDMARVVPCCGVWDDHDFAKNNSDSTDISPELRSQAVRTWLQYWGNNQPISTQDLGLTTRISHGLVDLYLLDGRFNRDKKAGVCFGQDLIDALIQTISERGEPMGRVVVLATGSSWNHTLDGKTEQYGHKKYDDERELLFRELRALMGTRINGLLLLSGDSHINEIYHVDLGNGRVAPEFSSSPLTKNTGLFDEGRDIEGERVDSFPTGGDEGLRGFATLTIDATGGEPGTPNIPEGNWSATVRYYQEAGAGQYKSRSYTLSNGQFLPT